MSCTRLRPAWKTWDIDKNGNEYRAITFSKKESAFDADYQIPCGKCDGCHADARRDWGIRMYHEAQYHEQNSFLTLTYDDDNCPEYINKLDLDRFLARIRKKLKLRYFITGEYGDQTHRPHYHAIIFGHDFRGGRFTYRINDELWGNEELNRTWSHGQITIGDFSAATAMYVAGYTAKKLQDKDTFSVQSRKPPLGWRWANDNQEQLRRLEHVVVEGRKLPIPKVYFEWENRSKNRPGEVGLDDVKANRQSHTKHLWEQEQRSKEINQAALRQMRSQKI